MKRILIRCAAAAGIGFALLCALTVALTVLDPEGMKAARERSKAAKAARADQKLAKKSLDESGQKIVRHAFTKGYTMAKLGAVKPSSDEVDALARRAANELGDNGGLGFKTQWKSAFWNGWNKGD